MRSVALKLAARSLLRNPRRTLLSVVGITLGCTLAVVMIGFQYGGKEVYVRAAVEGGIGHVRISPAGWAEQRDVRLRLADPDGALKLAQTAPHVVAAAPRVRAQVLLAMGSRVEGVELVGVDPAVERKVNRIVKRVVSGRYLDAGDEGAIVLGAELARRLRVEVDDDLVVTGVSPSGELQSALLRICGIVTTGSRGLDAGFALTSVADAAFVSGSPGLGEVSVLLDDFDATPAAVAFLKARLGRGDEVLDWLEVEPELFAHIEQDRANSNLMVGLVILLVFLGLASAELSSVLERRKEYAVLAAIGVRPRQLAAQSVAEGFALGAAATVVALIVSTPLLWWLHQTGLDISAFITADTSFEGVAIEPRFYTGFGWWIVKDTAALAILSTTIASLYPAWFAARVDPSTALRVAQ